MHKKERNYLSKQEFLKRNPFITPRSLKNLLDTREKNGLSPAVKFLGRKLLIDEDAFFRWMDAPKIDPKRVYREIDAG